MSQIQVQENDRQSKWSASVDQEVFNYDFPITAESELTVTKKAIADGAVTNPSILSSTINASGGTVTIAACADGDLITIQGNIPVERSSNYLTYVVPTDLNYDFNKLTKMVQELARDVSRSAKLPPQVLLAVDATLPEPVGDSVIGWDTAGTALENTLLSTMTNPAEVSTVEAEAGTESALRSWSPVKVKEAIDALSSVAQTASEVPIGDAGGLITATDVEGALAENRTAIDALEAVGATDDQTASEVPIVDSAGLITATDVEGALAENRTAIDALEAVGATDDQTAGEILTALLTVDGTGSLLDADLLDGVEAAAFAKADGSVPFTGDVKVTSATLMLDRGADLAPAEPLVLGTDGNFFKITGAGVSTIATITGLNATHSTEVTLEFGGAITLTHGGGLQLPNDESRKTRPGDILKFIESSSGVWICTSWQTAFFEEESFVVALSGSADDVATGIAVESFRFPYAFSITEVRLSLVTAGITGLTTVDINYTGVGSILSTKLTIDSTEKTSTTAVAAAVLTSAPNTINFGDDDEVTFDIDTVATGTAPKGLKVTLIGYRTP